MKSPDQYTIDQRHPMRAVFAARTKEELLDLQRQVEELPHIDAGVADTISQRLLAFRPPEGTK